MTNPKDPFKYSFDRLEDVADHISEVLQCPITIEDVNHKLLAYSTHSDCTDPADVDDYRAEGAGKSHQQTVERRNHSGYFKNR